MRILVELRRDSKPEKILSQLYQKTGLQSNFGATLLAIVNGQPKQLPLKEFLEIFIEFRELTIVKRTKNELIKTKERFELVNGLLKALKNSKIVINMIETAKDAAEAKARLMVRLDINEKQADGILAMPLRRLTNLETQSLFEESKELKIKKKSLEIILNNRTGFLCDNYAEMLEAISNINYLDNEECRNDASKRFSVEKYTEGILKIHNDILKR